MNFPRIGISDSGGSRFRRMGLWMAGAILLTVAAGATAQSSPRNFPQRPIRLVVPFPAGGGIDGISRLIGQSLQAAIGQAVVIDNRAGAGGLIAAEFVAKSPPDGYTLLSSAPVVTVAPSLYGKLSFNPQTDLAPVTRLTTSPTLLVINPAVPARTLEEFIALARARPGKLNFASGGVGTSQHMAAELLKFLAGIDVVHAPYKGSVPAQSDLIAGRIDFMFVEPAMLSLVKAGKLRALGVSTASRYAKAPDLPTIAEAGLPGYASMTWYGVFAPGGTPRDLVTTLNREIIRTLARPEVRDYLIDHGYEPAPESPEQFAQFLQADIAKWSAVVKASGLRME